MLKFVTPDISRKADLLAYRHEILLADRDFDGCAGLGNFPEIEDWLLRLAMMTPGAAVRGYFPTLVYLAYDDGELVGMLNIRLSNDSDLRRYAGHIGYNVRPSMRHRGTAHEMLEYAVKICRANGISEPTVCTEKGNLPSQKTALSCGFVRDGEEKLKNGDIIVRFILKDKN